MLKLFLFISAIALAKHAINGTTIDDFEGTFVIPAGPVESGDTSATGEKIPVVTVRENTLKRKEAEPTKNDSGKLAAQNEDKKDQKDGKQGFQGDYTQQPISVSVNGKDELLTLLVDNQQKVHGVIGADGKERPYDSSMTLDDFKQLSKVKGGSRSWEVNSQGTKTVYSNPGAANSC